MIVIDPLITIIQYALQLYVWVVIAAAILSWLVTFNVVNARNQVVYQIANALYRLTEPALRPISAVPAESRRYRHLAGDSAADHLLPADGAGETADRPVLFVTAPYP